MLPPTMGPATKALAGHGGVAFDYPSHWWAYVESDRQIAFMMRHLRPDTPTKAQQTNSLQPNMKSHP